jgi:hypothetical protein
LEWISEEEWLGFDWEYGAAWEMQLRLVKLLA